MKCLWAEIASGPTQIAEVIERLNTSAQEADPGERMLRVGLTLLAALAMSAMAVATFTANFRQRPRLRSASAVN